MKCPHCENQPLTMSERQGVEIDYCPQCRSVWLDRGELDKLVERSASLSFAGAPAQPAGHGGHARPLPPRTPKSWLSELFD